MPSSNGNSVVRLLFTRLHGVTDRVAHFKHDQSGSVAIIFVLALIPIMLAVGAAVDYSFANRVKAKLDAIADFSALAAVNKAAMSTTAAGAKKNRTDYFNAQIVGLGRVTVGNVTVDVSDSSAGRAAVVMYKASVPTVFMGLVGTMPISDAMTALFQKAVQQARLTNEHRLA